MRNGGQSLESIHRPKWEMARGIPLLEKREKWGTPSFFGVRHELREDRGHPPITTSG